MKYYSFDIPSVTAVVYAESEDDARSELESILDDFAVDYAEPNLEGEWDK